MKDVADHAGVALSSVSRVLNGHPAVSESLRQRVLSAVAQLDYQPDFTASSLRRGSTMTVGFLVRDIANPLFADMVKSAEDRLHPQGYSLLVTNSDGDPERDAGHIRLLSRRKVDGLLLSLSSESDPETLGILRGISIPMVLIDRRAPGIDASVVTSDHFSGVSAATKHLAAQGHSRIALITGSRDVLASRERVRGYKAGLRASGIRLDRDLVHMGSYSQEFGESAFSVLLGLSSPPTAVIAGGSSLGYGVLRAIRERNLRMPDDMALVGCDSWPEPELFDPALTTVARDAAEVGRTAVDLLLELIAGSGHDERVLPTELVVRGTTDAGWRRRPGSRA